MNEAHSVSNQNRAVPDMSYSALHCESLLNFVTVHSLSQREGPGGEV